MDKVWIDFETRSRCDLKTSGAYKYSKHPSTNVLCMAWAVDDGVVQLWSAGDKFPDGLRHAIAGDTEIHAHNAQFERCIWGNCCSPRLGWPRVSFDQWRCTAAKAASTNHPRGLGACVNMLLPNHSGKDKEGNRLMKIMCQPASFAIKKCVCLVSCECKCPCPCEPICTCTGRKSNRACRCVDLCRHKCVGGCRCQCEWVEDEESLRRLGEYCKQDVEVERALDKKLPDWPEYEVKVWQANERINDRGVPIDYEFCLAAKKTLDETLASTACHLIKMTGGAITTGNQVQRMKKFVNERGVNMDSLNSDAVETALARNDIPDDVRDVLLFRQVAAGAAAKKYKSAICVVDSDLRARGLFLYSGASATGRFVSVKTQFQNMKKGSDETGLFREAVLMGDQELMSLLYGNSIVTELGKNVRSIVCAEKGHTLLRVDSSQIECRVLHWLSGNTRMLRLFTDGIDPYIDLAKKVFNKNVCKGDPERQVGKVAVLGLGFGMGGHRFKSQVWAQTSPKITLNDKFSNLVVGVYRKDNSKVVEFWLALETAARVCVARKQTTRVGKLRFAMQGEYLTMKLPSGRMLYYFDPVFEGQGRSLRFSFTPPRGRRSEWAGGLLCENAVQAVARDTLVHYMLLAHERGLDLFMHVHDELIAMARLDEAEEHGRIMTECFSDLPPWAAGLPCDCELTIGARYA